MAVLKSSPQPFAPGPALQDGSAMNSAMAFSWRSVASGLTAIGANLAGALLLQAAVNQIAVAAAATGVALPNLAPGQSCDVYNDGANPITVYSGHATIDGVAGAVGVTLTNALRCTYTCMSPGVYQSAKLGAVSS